MIHPRTLDDGRRLLPLEDLWDAARAYGKRNGYKTEYGVMQGLPPT